MTAMVPKIRSTGKSEEFKTKELEPFKNVIKKFSSHLKRNNITYYKIGNLKGGHLYKYMDLETALICLENGTLRFVEPSMWEDKYESRFYTAKYQNVIKGANEADLCPITYSCCFTSKKNNEAAWKIYTYGKKGLGARCVEFTLNKSKFRGQIINHLKDCSIYEGVVSYIWEDDINHLDKKQIAVNKKKVSNPWYDLFFSGFGKKEFLNLMLLKRDAFEHEKETRIMIVKNQDNNKTRGKKHTRCGKAIYGYPLQINNKDVEINWGDIIEEVRYDDTCTPIEIKMLSDVIRKLVGFTGDDKAWIKDKRSPKCYYVYGKRKQITIQ